MISLYNGDNSAGGKYVAKILREEYGKEARLTKEPASNDYVVGWGYGMRGALNGRARNGKFWELKRLSEKGVNTPPYRTSGPGEGWLGRRDTHQEGKDFTESGFHADYWTKFIPNRVEFRIHTFHYNNIWHTKWCVSIKTSHDAHPWMRNTSAGWEQVYEETAVRAEIARHQVDGAMMARVAQQATEAMDYKFAAVDMAWTMDNKPLVFEVNSQPYIPGWYTGDFYAKGIKWHHGQQ